MIETCTFSAPALIPAAVAAHKLQWLISWSAFLFFFYSVYYLKAISISSPAGFSSTIFMCGTEAKKKTTHGLAHGPDDECATVSDVSRVQIAFPNDVLKFDCANFYVVQRYNGGRDSYRRCYAECGKEIQFRARLRIYFIYLSWIMLFPGAAFPGDRLQYCLGTAELRSESNFEKMPAHPPLSRYERGGRCPGHTGGWQVFST